MHFDSDSSKIKIIQYLEIENVPEFITIGRTASKTCPAGNDLFSQAILANDITNG